MTSTVLPDEAREIAAVLRDARSVVVCGHVNPDGDSVGSVLACTLALRALAVDATATSADAEGLPSTYAFLAGFSDARAATELAAPDVFLALDTPTWDRLGIAADLARSAERIIVVDHHPDDRPFGTLRWVDSRAAATGELVWHLLAALGVEPDADIAACLYTALLTDTGRFSYGNTDPDALRAAADMIAAGADAFAIYTRIYESRSPASLRVLGEVLARIEVLNDGRVAVSWLDEADLVAHGANGAETENLIDAVRQVAGIDVAVLVKCVGDGCRVSLRSKSLTDVAAVAARFGGGGHTAAAGYTVALDREAAVAALLPLLPGGDAA